MNEHELTLLLKQALEDVVKIYENEEFVELAEKRESINYKQNKEEYNQISNEIDSLYNKLFNEIVNKFNNDQIKNIFLLLSDDFYQKNKIQKSKTMWNPMEQILKSFIENINDSNFIDNLVENDEFINFFSYNEKLLGNLMAKCNNEELIRKFINNIGLIEKKVYDVAFSSILISSKIDSSIRERLIDEYIDTIISMDSLDIIKVLSSDTISKEKRYSLLKNNKITNKLQVYGVSEVIASLCDTKEELEKYIFDQNFSDDIDLGKIITDINISSKEKLELLLDERIQSKIVDYQFINFIEYSKIDTDDKISILSNSHYKKIILNNSYELGSIIARCDRKLLLYFLSDKDYFNLLVNAHELAGLFENRYNPFSGERFDSTLTTEDKLKLLSDKRLINGIDNYLLYVILNDEDIPEDIKIKMMFNDNIFYKVIDEYHEIYNPNSSNKGPFKYDKKEYLIKLFKKNPTLYKTINFNLLKDDILDIGPDFIEKISKYPDVVENLSILIKGNSKLNYFTNMMRVLETLPYSNDIDLQQFTTRLISVCNGTSVIINRNPLKFEEPCIVKLMYNLNADSLNDEEWKVLLEIGLRDQLNYYRGFDEKHQKIHIDIGLNIFPNIPGSDDPLDLSVLYEDLEKKNKEYLDKYKEKRKEKCDEVFKEAIANKNLYMAKNAYLNKYLNINIQEAEEIYRMFGHSLDKISNDLIIYKYLNSIKMVLGIEKLDTLIDSYNDNITSFTFEETIFLDQQLKQLFTKDMSNSVYRIVDDNGNFIKKTSNYATYNYEENGQLFSKQIPVYDSGLDFKMLIHSTAAYGELTLINDNYFDSWNKSDRKKNHGICCSLISNDNMGMAAVNDVLFGFDGWDSKAIVKSSPYDLYTSNDGFDIKEQRQMTYMTAQDIINNTRHTHNEQVLERTELREDKINLEYPNIQPSYVIIYSDMTNEIKNKAIKCASDMNIPIVYIDKQRIVENESRKIDTLIENINQTSNIEEKISYLEQALTSHENNRSGLKMTNSEWVEQYFPSSKMDNLIKKIISDIQEKYKNDNNIIEYYRLSSSLIDILENENKKFEITMESVERKNYIDIPVKEYRNVLIGNINSDLCRKSLPKMKDIIDMNNSENNDTEFAQNLHEINSDEFNLEVQQLQEKGFYQEDDKNHNIGHIERVMVLSKIIGTNELKKYDGKSDDHLIGLLIESAKYHDCGRENDQKDKNHGKRSATLIKEHLKDKYSDVDMSIMQVAIEFHEMEDNDFYFNKLCEKYNIDKEIYKDKARKVANCLKDADALDRLRFKNGAKLDISYLRTESSKKIIPFAKQLIKEYENYDLNMFRKMIVEQNKNIDNSSNIEKEKETMKL